MVGARHSRRRGSARLGFVFDDMDDAVEEDAGARRARLKALRAAADAQNGGASIPVQPPSAELGKTKLASPFANSKPSSAPISGFYTNPMAAYESHRDGNISVPGLLGPPGPPGAPGRSGAPPPPSHFGMNSAVRFPPPPIVGGRGGYGGRGGRGGRNGHNGHNGRGQKRERDFDRGLDAYYSKSMVEDPWRHLIDAKR